MRLIDADKYKNQLCENCIDKLKHGEKFCPCGRVLCVDYFPTAYDVDNVVEELEDNEEFYRTLENDSYYEAMYHAFSTAIDIVKRGGVNEHSR